jgi:hypothetical protein
MFWKGQEGDPHAKELLVVRQKRRGEDAERRSRKKPKAVAEDPLSAS